jgi:hypothetical protein
LRGRTVSEKLPKTPLVGPSSINPLRLLGSQQHPQSGVLVTSFSTWGAENSLAEINLERTGVIKGCNIFWGQKLANACSFVGGRIIVQKNLKSRNPLSESEKLVLGMFKDSAINLDATRQSFLLNQQ